MLESLCHGAGAIHALKAGARIWGRPTASRSGESVAMLESLCQGAGTLHELNLSGAFPERARYRPRELYAALKATPLFDAERGQWNEWMSEEQIPAGTLRHADFQLLGVLTEAQFNRTWAWGLYEKLKASPLYDRVRGQWNRFVSEDQSVCDRDCHTDIQLFGALVEARFNPEGARVMYEKLKATELYDSLRGQWNEAASAAQMLCETDRYAATQLLGLLVEARFDAAQARKLYEQLKTTSLYDPARAQWNWCMSEEQKVNVWNRHADAQLLGVLVEAQFNPERAEALYEALMATPLYDRERGQWNECMSEDQLLLDTYRVSVAQLLGVLVEATLLAELPRSPADAVPPLPVMEDWRG